MRTRDQASDWVQEEGNPNPAPQYAPQEEFEQLLLLSRYIPDEQAALEYAQRAAELHPEDPRVQESVQRSVLAHLSHDAFVNFVADNAKNYVITFRNSRPVLVPKAYAQPEAFPSQERTVGERALGMIWWMLLGLLPVGVGALVLSPIVIRRAWEAGHRRGADARERRLAGLAMILASGIGLLGALFTLLLVLHLVA